MVFKPSLWARLLLSANWQLDVKASEKASVKISGARTRLISTREITDISTQQGIIWSTIEITTPTGVSRLEGLSGRKALEIKASLLRHINSWISSVIASSLNELEVFDNVIKQLITSQSQYLAKSDILRAISGVGSEGADAISHPLLNRELLSTTVQTALPQSIEFLTDSTRRQNYNQSFVKEELIRFRHFFDSVLSSPLTDEQREACIRLEDSNLLVAAAGSGKTATMVAKVLYLLQKKIYKPEEILLLAFNKDAAKELEQRLSKMLEVDVNDLKVKVSTFHALGLEIIETADNERPQIANWVEHTAGRVRVLDQILKELSECDADFAKSWRDLLIYYPKADLPVQSFSSQTDYQRYIEDRRLA